jgi:glycosyltransferase involved in cell wall biosynthesis
MAYLSISLATPLAVRRKMQPLTRWLRARVSRRAPVAATESATAEQSVGTSVAAVSTGYQIKMPVTKAGAPKISHVIANFMTGGSSRLVVDLVEYLGHDYEQFVLTSYAPNPPAYIGMSIEEQRDCNDITPFINYFERTKPDFVHVHYWGDVDEPWYAQAIEAARVLNIPVIENINTPIAPHMSPAVKRYVYVSDYVRHVFGRPDASHVTVYPGSDFSHFMRDESEGVPKDCVGMVYRLECDKLNEHAIEPFIAIALKRPQTKVLIVGGGSLLSPFQQAVQKAGVASQFEFTGYVDYNTLPDYYRRMSLFIAPVWKESFGQVSPFAMNMRVPVIGYDVGAISEIVNSKTMLAPAGDANKLADIAIELLDNDALRAEMGHEHQQRAEGLFSVQAMISAYADLYAEMTEK